MKHLIFTLIFVSVSFANTLVPNAETVFDIDESLDVVLFNSADSWGPSTLAFQIKSAESSAIDVTVCSEVKCYVVTGWGGTIYIPFSEVFPGSGQFSVTVKSPGRYALNYWFDNSGIITEGQVINDEIEEFNSNYFPAKGDYFLNTPNTDIDIISNLQNELVFHDFPESWTPNAIAIQFSGVSSSLSGLFCFSDVCYDVQGFSSTFYVPTPAEGFLQSVLYLPIGQQAKIKYWFENKDKAVFDSQSLNVLSSDDVEEEGFFEERGFISNENVNAIPSSYLIENSADELVYDYSGFSGLNSFTSVAVSHLGAILGNVAPIVEITSSLEGEENELDSLGVERISPFYKIHTTVNTHSSVEIPFPISEDYNQISGKIQLWHFNEKKDHWERISISRITNNVVYADVFNFSTFVVGVVRSNFSVSPSLAVRLSAMGGACDPTLQQWKDYDFTCPDPFEDRNDLFGRKVADLRKGNNVISLVEMKDLLEDLFRNAYEWGLREFDLRYQGIESDVYAKLYNKFNGAGLISFPPTLAPWGQRSDPTGEACFNTSEIQCASALSYAYGSEILLQVIQKLNRNEFSADPIRIGLILGADYDSWNGYENQFKINTTFDFFDVEGGYDPLADYPTSANVVDVLTGVKSSKLDIMTSDLLRKPDITSPEYLAFVEEKVSNSVQQVMDNYPDAYLHSVILALDQAGESTIGIGEGVGIQTKIATMGAQQLPPTWSSVTNELDKLTPDLFESFVQMLMERESSLYVLYKTFGEAAFSIEPDLKIGVFNQYYIQKTNFSMGGHIDFYRTLANTRINMLQNTMQPLDGQSEYKDHHYYAMAFSSAIADAIGGNFGTELTWAQFDYEGYVNKEEDEDFNSLEFKDPLIWCNIDCEYVYRKQQSFLLQFAAAKLYGADFLRFANWNLALFEEMPTLTNKLSNGSFTDFSNYDLMSEYLHAYESPFVDKHEVEDEWEVMKTEGVLSSIKALPSKELGRYGIYLPSVGSIFCELQHIQSGGIDGCNDRSPIPEDVNFKNEKVMFVSDEMFAKGKVDLWRYRKIFIPKEYTLWGERKILELLEEIDKNSKIVVEGHGTISDWITWLTDHDRIIDVTRNVEAASDYLERSSDAFEGYYNRRFQNTIINYNDFESKYPVFFY